MEKIWLKQYPAGVPAQVRTDLYPSLVALLEESFRKHRDLPACKCMGRSTRYGQVDDYSRALAAWLQSLGLVRGERVAVMLPNVAQYLVAVAAILRAGLVVVNVNPLHTPRELEHQLKDSGAKAIVIFENVAHTLAQVLEQVPTKHVLLASLGDMLGRIHGALVNHLERRVKKRVPPFSLPCATRFNDAVARGRRMTLAPAAPGPDDIAVLQYAVGTTAANGVSKGCVLLHRNLVANLLQNQAWYKPALQRLPAGEQLQTVCVLPLHQVFGFNLIMLLGLHMGGCMLLIPNSRPNAQPDAQQNGRDLAGLLKVLSRQRVHSFPALEPMFNALAHHPHFERVDWSHLKLSIGSGMAVQQATAKLWLEKTGCPICEAYGLSEASPGATCNPVDATAWAGSIGLPLPNTELTLLDDEGQEVPPGSPGEVALRGPQVMAGYWQRPDETAKLMVPGGWFRSGDIGFVDERGFFRIACRKQDLILVSGFSVYPSEIEDLVAQMPGVQECAAVGMADAKAGEAVKLVVVRLLATSRQPSEAEVRAFCEAHLTGYKRPKVVEFRSELPKTAQGTVLRRALRDSA